MPLTRDLQAEAFKIAPGVLVSHFGALKNYKAFTHYCRVRKLSRHQRKALLDIRRTWRNRKAAQKSRERRLKKMEDLAVYSDMLDQAVAGMSLDGEIDNFECAGPHCSGCPWA